jgi:hypothetical protein
MPINLGKYRLGPINLGNYNFDELAFCILTRNAVSCTIDII